MSLQEKLLEGSTESRPFLVDWEEVDHKETITFKGTKLTFRQNYYNFIIVNKWYFYMHLVLTLINVIATLVFSAIQNLQFSRYQKEDIDYQTRLHIGMIPIINIRLWNRRHDPSSDCLF